MEKRQVVLYGNSVIVGTLGASLQQLPQYEVTPLLPTQQNELESLAPDVVLFDLEAARPEAAFSVLEKRPGMILIGISPDTNLVKVWSGRQLQEISTQDLIEVINNAL
jgi:hypothetical protein